jgi:hypothetical protein
MRNINKRINLLVFGIYIITVQSYENVKFIHDDTELNEISYEIIDHRDRDRQDEAAMLDDEPGSGDFTCENMLIIRILELSVLLFVSRSIDVQHY